MLIYAHNLFSFKELHENRKPSSSGNYGNKSFVYECLCNTSVSIDHCVDACVCVCMCVYIFCMYMCACVCIYILCVCVCIIMYV